MAPAPESRPGDNGERRYCCGLAHKITPGYSSVSFFVWLVLVFHKNIPLLLKFDSYPSLTYSASMISPARLQS
jgi:hypothetical protein